MVEVVVEVVEVVVKCVRVQRSFHVEELGQ
jgi:hypothetical protein